MIQYSDEAYDPNEIIDPYKVVSYQYDAFNRPVSRALNPDGQVGRNTIDTFFAGFDGNDPTLQFGDGGTVNDLEHRYLWGAGRELLADEVVSSTGAAGEILWPMTDAVGTIRDIGKFNGTTGEFEIVNHRVYDSFGKLLSGDNTDVAFGFTGRWTDVETGMSNHLHRWYDSAIGRWISEDPIGFAAGDANVSRYAANNPLSFTDPDGLDIVPIDGDANQAGNSLNFDDSALQNPSIGYKRFTFDYDNEIIGVSLSGMMTHSGGPTVSVAAPSNTAANGWDYSLFTLQAIGQTAVNGVQGLQDMVITVANSPAFLLNSGSWMVAGNDYENYFGYWESNQWARGLISGDMSDGQYELSKFSTSSAILMGGGTWLKVSARGQQVTAGVNATAQTASRIPVIGRLVPNGQASTFIGRWTNSLASRFDQAFDNLFGRWFAPKTGVSPRTPVGHRGKPINVIPGTNKPTTIGGRKFTGHALDRMQERGLTPSVVEDTIARGTRTPSRGGTTVIKTDQAGVVINSNGDVVTVYPQ